VDSGLNFVPVLPKISSVVNLSDPKSLYGIKYRVIGISSLHFLHTAMLELKPHMLACLPPIRHKNVEKFYSQVDQIPDLTNYLFQLLASKLTNWEKFVLMVSESKWEIKEMGIDSSAYVSYIVGEFKDYNLKLTEELKKTGKIPVSILDIIWAQAVGYLMYQLVEGYSRVKKCTNEGRAQMLLDLKMLQDNLQRFTHIKPLPGIDLVSNYVKAYYTTEVDFVTWCKTHTEYSMKQMIALVNLAPALAKSQDKKKIISNIEQRSLNIPSNLK